MKIIKSYVTVITDSNQRLELKFDSIIPLDSDIKEAIEKIEKPTIPVNNCPMNNPKCPLYKSIEVK